MDQALFALSISQTATRALAATNNAPMTESNLRLYREDAHMVAVAILRAIAGFDAGKVGGRVAGVEPISRQQLRDAADFLVGVEAAALSSKTRTA